MANRKHSDEFKVVIVEFIAITTTAGVVSTGLADGCRWNIGDTIENGI